jgi:hypothetical protein
MVAVQGVGAEGVGKPFGLTKLRCWLWVSSDQFAVSTQCPLVPQYRPDRCAAIQ